MPLRIPEAFCYIVRQGPNPELMFSLRSVHAHFPGTPVFIVGDKPAWVRGVEFLQGNRMGEKTQNIWDNLRLATQWTDLPDNIVIFNDDMYITTMIDEIPTLYRGTLADHIASLGDRDDWWSNSMKHTAAELRKAKVKAPLSYELHTPFPCRKTLLGEALDRDPGQYPPQWRTLYGNLHQVPATQHPDVKVTRMRHNMPPGPFVSTNDISIRWIREPLRVLYPYPSPFEAPRVG